LTYDMLITGLAIQDGRCPVSLAPLTDRSMWAIDHCHKTGVIRGILEWHINRGLGAFDDRPDLLLAAADYIDHAAQAAHASA
jgi:hypothetical protein